MPLINLKTNLKSLGYGNDRPNGGSSNQPYIVTPIPEGETLNSPDFLLRNGYLNPVSSVKDVSRLVKYFFDTKSPSGLLFTAKQELLERQNPKLVNIDRVYLPTSTTAQAGVLSIGGHLNKQGLDTSEPSYYLGGTYGYYYATRGLGANPSFQTLSNGDIENRLTIAYTAKIANQSLGSLAINPFGITNLIGNTILLSYPGGPGSILGIGLTNIRIQNPTIKKEDIYQEGTYFTEEIFNNPHNTSTLENQFFVSHKTPTYLYNPNLTYDKVSSIPGLSKLFFNQVRKEIGDEPLDSNLFGEGDINELLTRNNNNITSSVDPNNNVYIFSYKQTIEQSSKATDKTTSLDGIVDFRKTIKDNNKTAAIPNTSYKDFNREKTYDSSKTTYRGNYSITSGSYILDPNEAISPDQTEVGERGEDIVDFNFTIINNTGLRSDSDPEYINRLIDFKAYIETWGDGVNGDWSPIKYMGRAEQFYKYNGFSREANVTFLIPALSRADMVANYRKLNALIWATAPSYSSTKEGAVAGLMRGSITYVTMGDYFRRMPSIIKSLSFSEIEGMGWDINRDQNGETIPQTSSLYVGQLPKGIRVQINFTPLHDFVPQYGEAFIGQNDKYIPPNYGKPIWKDTADQQSTTSGYYLR